MTTIRRGLSLHVEVETTSETGLDVTSYVQCELIRSINHNRLIHHLGVVGSDISSRLHTILEALLNH